MERYNKILRPRIQLQVPKVWNIVFLVYMFTWGNFCKVRNHLREHKFLLTGNERDAHHARVLESGIMLNNKYALRLVSYSIFAQSAIRPERNENPRSSSIHQIILNKVSSE